MQSKAMVCQYDVEVPMRDGVILRGDLYRPAQDGVYPAILYRTVFRKDLMGRNFAQYDPAFFVRHGYAVFIQDVRGLGKSDGEFSRFCADGPDGYDTVEWLAAQPYCSGQVGMMGNYYAGYLQLMAAVENPPHLKAICPAQTSVSINRDCDNRGFTFASHIGWCMSRQINRLRDGRYDAQTTERWLPQLLEWLSSYPTTQLTSLPLTSMPAANQTPFPLLEEYRRHLLEGYDRLDLLHKEGRDLDVSRIRVPAFYYCGWYDSSRTPLLMHCMAQRNAGVDSRVLVAPWRMGESPAAPDSALENGEHAVDVQQDMLHWFNHWLKGAEEIPFPPIRYTDMKTGEMFTGEAWPLSQEAYTLYLASGGRMLSQAENQEDFQLYRHDPQKPLPYHPYGEAGVFSPSADDTRLIHYQSDPLPHSLSIRGMVSCRLYVSSSARDADVMVTLSELAPDGRRFILCDGATRLSYRKDWQLRPLNPGEVYEVDVLMGHLCCTVTAGRRLVLEIGGSAFPKYDVNPGTGLRTVDAVQKIATEQCVWQGGTMRSSLTLPIAGAAESD